MSVDEFVNDMKKIIGITYRGAKKRRANKVKKGRDWRAWFTRELNK